MMIEYQVTEHKAKNCIVRVHKPILSDEERNKREEEVKTALNRFGRERRSKL